MERRRKRGTPPAALDRCKSERLNALSVRFSMHASFGGPVFDMGGSWCSLIGPWQAELGIKGMSALLTDPNAWAALLTLTALEIVLGIDNVVFVSLLAANLDAKSGRTARQIGFALAFIFRLALLFSLTTLGKLRYPVLVFFGDEFTWRDVILIGGGLFLIAKAIFEIHREIDVDEHPKRSWGSNANTISWSYYKSVWLISYSRSTPL